MVSEKIDLHIHTRASDGKKTPEEIVSKAKAYGLETIAITDHDNLAGIEEAIVGGKPLGLEVIPGVELSVQYKDYKDIHILGYYIRWREGELVNILLEFQQRRLERGEKILAKINQCLKNKGRRPLDYESILLEAKGGSLGRMHLARKLIEHGYVIDINEAFSRYLNPCNIPKARCAVQEAIDTIKGAAGLSVLAHPRLITPDQKVLEEIVAELKGYGLDGLEGIYPGLAYWELKFYQYLCQKYDLILTGGSDYHGDEAEDRLGVAEDYGRLNYSLVINLRQRFFDQKSCLICIEDLPNQFTEPLIKNIIDHYGFQLLSFSDFSPRTGTGWGWDPSRLIPILKHNRAILLGNSLPKGFWEFLEKQGIKTFIFCPEQTPKKNYPTSCITWIPVTKLPVCLGTGRSAHFLIHLIALSY